VANNAQVNFTIAARNQASGAIAGVNKSLGGLRAKTIAVGSAIGTALGTVAVQAFSKLTDFIGSSIGQASNLNETMSKTRVIFGDAADDVIAFAQAAGDSLGLSQQAALDASSTFAVFAQSAGLGGKELSQFSGDLVTLSADFASFYNTSPEQAITAIGAALRGESEPIRKYNILLNDATLRQRAMTLGIIKNTKTALTPQQKVLAAQAEIMAQSTVAQGDFARTSGGLANQQRILSAAMDNLSADLGTAFMPILQEAIGFITGTVIPTFRNNFVPVIEKLKEVFGDVAETVKKVVGPIMQALQPIIDKVSWNFKVLMSRLGPVVDMVKFQFLVALSRLAGFMRDVVGPAISDFVALLDGPFGMALKVLAGAIVGVKIALMAYNAVLGVWSALQTAGAAITGVFTAAQAALNIVLNMNPISLIVLAIAALIGAFIAAYAASEDFRNIVNGIFDAITGLIGVIVGGLVGAFELLVSVAKTVGEALMNSPLGIFFKLAMAVAEGIGGILGAVFGGGNKPSPTASTGSGVVTGGINGSPGMRTSGVNVAPVAVTIGTTAQNSLSYRYGAAARSATGSRVSGR
jgi:phage-related protein